MIVIPNITTAGFGNKVFYYNNMRQLAAANGEGFACPPWEGKIVFDLTLMEATDTQAKQLPFCLGENFFKWSTIPTRSIFKLKEFPIIDKNQCSIHLRGTDFHDESRIESVTVGQREQYYFDAIASLKDEVNHFYLFTDDQNMPQFKSVLKKLQDSNLSYSFGQNTADRGSFAADFLLMSQCEYMISSPSTFNIAAGFVGVEKKIIHSKDWIDNRVERNDKFWIDLANGGNDDYSIWRLV
tara:strand:+ start:7323 stop:8042 length:720 start_codon:yes stop_codon:yes gene_type:complete